MLPVERRRRILEQIEAEGSAQIKELSAKYNVSEMTVRRDLDALEKKGHVKRTHGGAIRLRKSSTEPRYAAKQQIHASQKSGIARYAAYELVNDGEVIILEGGTTVTTMARYLTNREDLTIVTNGLHTMNELQSLLSEHTVICCGGLLRDVAFTFVGPVAESFFREFHANKVFLSATGWTQESGFMDPSMLETQAKKAMQAASEQTVLLLDASKFDVHSLSTVLRTEEVDVVITDAKAPSSAIRTLRDAGVDVRLVPSDATAPYSESAISDGREK